MTVVPPPSGTVPLPPKAACEKTLKPDGKMVSTVTTEDSSNPRSGSPVMARSGLDASVEHAGGSAHSSQGHRDCQSIAAVSKAALPASHSAR
jgi:hypothetical protein